MAKKVFYNRRYKMPGWLQPYAVWTFAALVTLAIVYFTSVESASNEAAAVLPVDVNGFAEGLFYELNEAETSEKYEVTLRFAERLRKKHGYAVREAPLAACRAIHLSRGSSAQWTVAAALQNGQDGGLFSVLVFLDRLAARNANAAISASLLFPRKGCAIDEAVRTLQTGGAFQVFVDAENSTPPYDPVPRLRNLNLRRHFPAAFLLPERTLWANVLALTAESSGIAFTVPAPRTKKSLNDLLAANPLLRHPAIEQADPARIAVPVALYLTANTQLHYGGFVALAVLLWLLAFIPLANALLTFRERFDPGSAFTSAVLYTLAFASYLLIYRLVLKFTRSDFPAAAFAILLIPAVFFPLRILQKTMLRAELNRPGLHLLILVFLTAALFLSPLNALVGLLQLTAASGYSRATRLRKLLRLLVVVAPVAFLALAASAPMGSLTNFLAAYLPAFSAASLPNLVILCLVGGNLTALLFVPRERI